MAFYCYMVECANGALYTGWTKDPIRREKEHNAGRGARYTRMNLPVKLVYVEEMDGHIEALKRELEIKRLPAPKKRLLVHSSANIILTIKQDVKAESSEDALDSGQKQGVNECDAS